MYNYVHNYIGIEVNYLHVHIVGKMVNCMYVSMYLVYNGVLNFNDYVINYLLITHFCTCTEGELHILYYKVSIPCDTSKI